MSIRAPLLIHHKLLNTQQMSLRFFSRVLRAGIITASSVHDYTYFAPVHTRA